MAFKMKGNPMQRNYGVGAPTKKSAYPLKGDTEPTPGADPKTEEGTQELIDNAMRPARKVAMGEETTEGMKKYFGGVNADMDAVRLAIRKASSIEGNSDHVKNMRKVAGNRYPKNEGFGTF